MPTYMSALSSNSIKVIEFVQLTLPDATFNFCNAASPVTVNGITFTGLGSLLGISEIQRDIKANSADLKVSLNGIDPNNIALILGAEIKGSTIKVWRGFLDTNNQIITSPTQQFFQRYQGIVNNTSIQEDWNEQLRSRIATCIVSSASMRIVLDARNAGIKTNQQLWQKFYPNDTSMDRVALIASTFFDFGKPPISGGQNSANTNTNDQTTNTD
jgi:hypothetical protein